MASSALFLMGIVEALVLQLSEEDTISRNFFLVCGASSSLTTGLKPLLIEDAQSLVSWLSGHFIYAWHLQIGHSDENDKEKGHLFIMQELVVIYSCYQAGTV